MEYSRAAALTWAQAQLLAAGQDDSPKLDADLLLCHQLGCSSASLYTWPEKILTTNQWQGFCALVEQRNLGRPIAHLLGQQGFWSLDLAVDASTLIPRPETELLVEAVLCLDLPAQAKVIDLGTGTGAIALALASEQPQWQITGVDQSSDAVALAQKNALVCDLQQVQFKQGDWANGWVKDPLAPIHCMVSNPPYIDAKDPHLSQGDVRYEPLSALVADDHGMADIQTIARQAAQLLDTGGWLAFEHGYDQGALVRQLLTRLGFAQVTTQQDYNGQDRVTLGQWP
ncbi:MAG TPA: peptide chain release factor N(5)-glutamine methyltransferase [Oceanospirillaceae bacterium]|nr:peptide chain release factor N(5)-glutamine methyltransferase [Oceanospirillaceae bacterium]